MIGANILTADTEVITAVEDTHGPNLFSDFCHLRFFIIRSIIHRRYRNTINRPCNNIIIRHQYNNPTHINHPHPNAVMSEDMIITADITHVFNGDVGKTSNSV
jgi:hypothetical protein